MPSCTEQGQVTCWDGSCQNTYAGCPAVSEGEEGSYVSGGEHGPYDNPWEDQDVLLGWIYQNMGGEGYFDMDEEEFITTYGDEWMEYNPTQAELIYDQLGLLDWAEDVRDEEFEINRDQLDLKGRSLLHSLNLARTGAENDLYSAVLQLEGVTRRGRGVRSGEAKKRSARAFGNIEDEYTAASDETMLENQGVVLDRESLDNAYDQSLIDFESRELNLIQDVYALEDQFEENLWAQINQRLANEVYAGTCGTHGDSDCGEGQECVGAQCVEAGTVNEPPPEGTCEDEGQITCSSGLCVGTAEDCPDWVDNIETCIPPQTLDLASGLCVDQATITEEELTGEELYAETMTCVGEGNIMIDGICSDDPMYTESVDWNQVPDGACTSIIDGDCYGMNPDGSIYISGPAAVVLGIVDASEEVVDFYNFMDETNICTDVPTGEDFASCMYQACDNALFDGFNFSSDVAICAGTVATGVVAEILSDLWGIISGETPIDIDFSGNWGPVDPGGTDTDTYGSGCTSDAECGSGMECVTFNGVGNCTAVSTGGGTPSGPGGPSGATQTSGAGITGQAGSGKEFGGYEDDCGGCPAGSECLMGTCVNYMA